ncbi:unnamed protein product [Prorocentrum cordatum]|uniref:RanBP2-type domain-containing protein n=1 Tax=Prorocentrum cordatum TaxID=2364126 RepID=A0ABN9WTI1_9DINO|nr:unnamed protein product [Polarella glacialis]
MSLYDAFVMAAGKRLAPDQGGGPAKMARGAEGEEGQWSCAACGNVNFAGRLVCNMRKCGAPRPAGDGGVGMAPQHRGRAWRRTGSALAAEIRTSRASSSATCGSAGWPSRASPRTSWR